MHCTSECSQEGARWKLFLARLVFPQTKKPKIIYAALLSVVRGTQPVEFFYQKYVMFVLEKALVEVGLSIPVTRKAYFEHALSCATTVREVIVHLDKLKREKYNKTLPFVIAVGGGIACDGLKNELTRDTFHDFVLHYI